MENTWCPGSFPLLMGLIAVCCQSAMALRDAYVSGEREQIVGAWRYALLFVGLAVVIAVGVCWIGWESFDAGALSEEARRMGFLKISFLHAVVALLLLFYPVWDLCKYTWCSKNTKLLSRQRVLVLLEITLFVVAFGVLYLVCPELLYGPYL